MMALRGSVVEKPIEWYQARGRWGHERPASAQIASLIGLSRKVRFKRQLATLRPTEWLPLDGGFDFEALTNDHGIVLKGQNLSLDLVLSNDVLARLFLSDPTTFGIGLTINTNAGTFPGFAGPTTGFLLGPSGNQLDSSQVAGRADSSDGSFSMGLVSFTRANLNGAEVIDISGLQLDTTLPNDGAVITNADLRFSFNGISGVDGVEFGTAQQLPEPSTLGLTLVGTLVLALAAGRKSLKQLFIHLP